MLGAVAGNVDHASAREEAWSLPTPESPAAGPVAPRGPRPARHPGRTECAYDPRRERESGSRDAPAALLRPLYCSAAPAGAVNGPPVRDAPRASSGVCVE